MHIQRALASLWCCLMAALCCGCVKGQICVKQCLCVRAEGVIDCNTADQLRHIPASIDSAYTRLLIQNANFLQPQLRADNVSRLTHVEQLKVIYSHLRSLESFTFLQMRALKRLDLSANQLTDLPPHTFSGLRLSSLELRDNVGLRLQRLSFHGLQVHTLDLANIGLTQLEFETFEHLAVQRLILFHNSIRFLDPRFKQLFAARSQSLLDLTENPLHCDCSVRWYMRTLTNSSASNGGSGSSIGMPDLSEPVIVCETPEKLFKRKLQTVSESALICPPAVRIREIHIDLSRPEWAKLRCVAQPTQPNAMLFWSQQSDSVGQRRSSSNSRQMMVSSLSAAQWNSSQPELTLPPLHTDVNVSLTSTSSSTVHSWVYTCSGQSPSTLAVVPGIEDDDALENEDRGISLRLRVPPPHSAGSWLATEAPPTTGTGNWNQRMQLQPPDRESGSRMEVEHLLFKRYFSLMELLSAVVATFLSTLTLLLGILLCSRKCRRAQHAFHNGGGGPSELSPLHHHPSSAVAAGGKKAALSHSASSSFHTHAAPHHHVVISNNNNNIHHSLQQKVQLDSSSGTLPPCWTSTYSGAEYDLPRLETTYEPVKISPAVPPQYPFIDYKTQHKFYPMSPMS